MSSVFSSLRRLSGTGLPPVSGRPENLRRATLAINARILTAVSLLASPFAAFGLVDGAPLLFVLTMIGLGAGVLSIALCDRGQFERAAAGQIYAILLAGLILALADPAIADFGLATALLAPVHASLLSRSPVKKRSWVMLVVVVLFSTAGATGLVYWPPGLAATGSVFPGVLFLALATMVAFSANRLNTGFEVYDKSQISAYRHLIEHVQDAVMRFAADGQVIFTSRSAEKLFGCRRYELSGTGLVDRIHVLDRPAYLTALAAANVDGTTRVIEVRMRQDDPHVPSSAPSFIWVEISLSPVLEEGTLAGRHEVVGLFRDVTGRKDIETEMRQARQLAEETSSAKSRFLATIGHELRTPLNAIVGFSEMMTSGVVGDLSPAHREYAELIRQSGHHLIEVVRMLLDMSRIEAGKFELQAEPFEPAGLVEPCFRIVDSLAREREVRLRADLPRALPSVTADERACRQVLINLLSNAIKFSKEGGDVTVAMRRHGRYLAISVTDFGVGMPPDAIARVGEPFFQAEEGLTRQYEGTGLGLSIVKGLVDLHEGRLDVQSRLGEGTTMTVLLPLNGPATKLVETPTVTPIHPDPVEPQMPEWREEKRTAL